MHPRRPEQGGIYFEMNDDEDSLASWLLAIGLGLALAVPLGLPIAWWIVWSVFK